MGTLVSVILCLTFSAIPVWANPAIHHESVVHVDGFRTARFGMTPNEVIRAIEQDFDIPERDINQDVNLKEKTESLWVPIHDLLPGSGPAKVYYIFGFKSKRLIQVNIFWGRPATDTPNPNTIVETANQLRDHFLRKNFEKDGLMVNAPLGEEVILVFRGKDAKGYMVVLLLSNIPSGPQATNDNISLRLSYISNPENPDVFRIKNSDF